MSPSADEIMEAAREILSRTEFQQKPMTDNWLKKYIQDWLLQVIPSEAWAVLFYIFLGALAIGALWILFKIIMSLIASMSKKSMAVAISDKTAENPPAKLGTITYLDARACLARGDTTAAIKALHHNVLASMESRELILRKKWKTNTDYADECKASPRWQQIHFSISRDFEKCVYGSIQIESEQIERQISLFETEASK